jgi:nickel transport system substrate-binding protein
MKVKKTLAAAVAAVLCSGFIAGCSDKPASTQAVQKEVLNYASTKDIRIINPHLYSGEMSAQNMVFEGLTKNEGGKVVPALAESWKISDDGMEYTFHLRKGVTFTDGSPLNAKAVKQNIDAVVGNLQRHAWLNLVNEIKEAVAVDEHTFKLVLKHPYYPTLVELGLTRPFRFISPNCFVNDTTKDGVSCYCRNRPVGPVRACQANQNATFTQNAGHWGRKTKLKSVRVESHARSRRPSSWPCRTAKWICSSARTAIRVDLDSYKKLQEKGAYTRPISASRWPREPSSSTAIRRSPRT